MSKAIIYTMSYCPYCYRAKRLMKKKGLQFVEHSVDGKRELRAELLEKTGSRTVPQIWISDEYVGGCDELFALERAGKLDALIAKTASN